MLVNTKKRLNSLGVQAVLHNAKCRDKLEL